MVPRCASDDNIISFAQRFERGDVPAREGGEAIAFGGVVRTMLLCRPSSL